MPTAPDPTGTAPKPKTSTIAAIIAAAAKALGVPPEVALATAWIETGGTLNPAAVGDNGTSFGEFQLHEGGELPRLPDGSYAIAAAEDPYTASNIALPHIASAKKANPGLTWGQAAAAGQRPQDPVGYAAKVDAVLARFYASGQDPVVYFSKHSTFGGVDQANAFTGPSTTGTRGGLGSSPTTPTIASSQVADDWIGGLDSVLNPSFGWNPLSDTGSVIKFVFARGGIAAVGLILIGGGILLMFGRDIFGGALAAAAPELAAAGGATRAATKASGAATATVA